MGVYVPNYFYTFEYVFINLIFKLILLWVPFFSLVSISGRLLTISCELFFFLFCYIWWISIQHIKCLCCQWTKAIFVSYDVITISNFLSNAVKKTLLYHHKFMVICIFSHFSSFFLLFSHWHRYHVWVFLFHNFAFFS